MLGGIVIVIVLTAVNIIGVRESARVNFVLAAIDYATQLLLVALGVFLVLELRHADPQHPPRRRARRGTSSRSSIPVAMISYTGLETISNMSEEARIPRLLVPRAYKVLVVAVLSIYACLPAVALSAMPVTQHRTASYSTQLADKYAGDPILGIVKNMGLGALEQPMQHLRRHPRGDDPAGRRERRARSASAASPTRSASTSSCRSGCATSAPARARRWSRSRCSRVLACLAMVPGQGDVPREHVRVRRDAVVHDRARLADRAALAAGAQPHAQAARRRRGGGRRGRAGTGRRSTYASRGVDVPLFAVIGGLLTATAWVTVMALHRDV